jgi:hypothetical protein
MIVQRFRPRTRPRDPWWGLWEKVNVGTELQSRLGKSNPNQYR